MTRRSHEAARADDSPVPQRGVILPCEFAGVSKEECEEVSRRGYPQHAPGRPRPQTCLHFTVSGMCTRRNEFAPRAMKDEWERDGEGGRVSESWRGAAAS